MHAVTFPRAVWASAGAVVLALRLLSSAPPALHAQAVTQGQWRTLYASFIDDPFDVSRVKVARSFSKIYGLAGLRVGYAVTSAHTARTLASQQLADSVSAVAARAAIAALEDAEHLRTSIRRNTDDLQEFLNQATARMLRQDSVTNFVMLDTGRAAAGVVEHFRQHGILVAGGIRGFDQHIRVSVGTAAEMREFWRVWDLVIGHKM